MRPASRFQKYSKKVYLVSQKRHKEKLQDVLASCNFEHVNNLFIDHLLNHMSRWNMQWKCRWRHTSLIYHTHRCWALKYSIIKICQFRKKIKLSKYFWKKYSIREGTEKRISLIRIKQTWDMLNVIPYNDWEGLASLHVYEEVITTNGGWHTLCHIDVTSYWNVKHVLDIHFRRY